jgi:hypothetical protein
MEYTAGMAVWLRGTAAEPFVSGVVASEKDGSLEVTLNGGGGKRTVSAREVFPASGRTASDHCALPYLNEPSVLENTRARFVDDSCYTFISDVLVAVNPFTPLPIYGPQAMARFVGTELGSATTSPHVYAMGEAAYTRVRAGATTAAAVSIPSCCPGSRVCTAHGMALTVAVSRPRVCTDDRVLPPVWVCRRDDGAGHVGRERLRQDGDDQAPAQLHCVEC